MINTAPVCNQNKRHNAHKTSIAQSGINAILTLACIIICALCGCEYKTEYLLTDQIYEKTHHDLDQLGPPRGLHGRYLTGSIITFNVYREFDLKIIDKLSIRSGDHALLEPLAGHCGDQCDARSILDDPYKSLLDRNDLTQYSKAFRVRRAGATTVSLYVDDELVESHVVYLIQADHIEATLDLSVSGQLLTQFEVSSEAGLEEQIALGGQHLIYLKPLGYASRGDSPNSGELDTELDTEVASPQVALYLDQLAVDSDLADGTLESISTHSRPGVILGFTPNRLGEITLKVSLGGQELELHFTCVKPEQTEAIEVGYSSGALDNELGSGLPLGFAYALGRDEARRPIFGLPAQWICQDLRDLEYMPLSKANPQDGAYYIFASAPSLMRRYHVIANHKHHDVMLPDSLIWLSYGIFSSSCASRSQRGSPTRLDSLCVSLMILMIGLMGIIRHARVERNRSPAQTHTSLKSRAKTRALLSLSLIGFLGITQEGCRGDYCDDRAKLPPINACPSPDAELWLTGVQRLSGSFELQSVSYGQAESSCFTPTHHDKVSHYHAARGSLDQVDRSYAQLEVIDSAGQLIVIQLSAPQLDLQAFPRGGDLILVEYEEHLSPHPWTPNKSITLRDHQGRLIIWIGQQARLADLNIPPELQLSRGDQHCQDHYDQVSARGFNIKLSSTLFSSAQVTYGAVEELNAYTFIHGGYERRERYQHDEGDHSYIKVGLLSNIMW